MAPTMATPVLVVDPDLIHKVDTRNVENLFSMWAVFSKCAGSVEQGRRLENLSWRLWNRETFCCEPNTQDTLTASALSIAPRTPNTRSTTDMPELSGSIDSLADEEAVDFDNEETTSTSAPLDIVRPRIVRQDSGASNRSRGRERHIGPDDLEKMVITIKQTSPATIKLQGPLELPPLSPALEPLVEEEIAQLAPIPAVSAQPMVEQVVDSPVSAKSAAVVSECGSGSSERSTTSIVRGFSPAVISNSYRSTPLPNIAYETAPKPTSVPATRNPANNKNAMFALGGSSQSGESFMASSVEDRVQPVQTKKKAVFAFGASSGSGEDENSFRDVAPHRSSLSDGLHRPGQAKKQTSFMEAVEERRIGDDNPFESDDEDDIDESAIDDDDDSSDWEDSLDESGKSSIDEKTFFQRVDSRPNLTSRRSMLTTLLHQGDRAAALGNIASKSTPALYRSRKSSPNGPSLAASPESDDAAPLMMKKGNKSPGGLPQTEARPIIMTTTNNTQHQAAHSPKTTRRNMLATELTASLRRNLLWERQQKNSTATAVLKRRHTAHTDLKDIKEHPERAHIDKDLKETQASWNQYFDQGLGEYHSKGW